MLADNVEHVITYWVLWQQFHSPALAGFQVISHWVPFLLFSVYFGGLADRFDCRRVIQAAQALFDMAQFEGVYLKLTNRTLAAAAQGHSTPAAFLEKLVSTFGAGRIAWGSNFPAAEGSLNELLATAREVLSNLPKDQQAMIFGGTVERIYPALAAVAA
jgi:MFS family permease